MCPPDVAQEIESHAPVFAALGDVTRLELVIRLSDGRPRSIAQLTSGLNLTRQGVTKHLEKLEGAGIVKRQHVGRESRFVFTPEPILRLQDYLARASKQWDEALARLRAFVEDRDSPPSG